MTSKQVNLRALAQEEACQLKLNLLGEKLRGLIFAVYAVDRDRLDRFEFPEDLSRPLPKRKKTKQELALEEELRSWPAEEVLLWGEITSFQEAARLVSERYLSGEELLYPDSARKLDITLSALAGFREVYLSVLAGRPPESDDAFARWLPEEKDQGESASSSAPEPAPLDRPNTQATARCLAKHFVLMARAEALDDLGERDAGIRLVQDWMRSEGARLFP